MPSRTGRHGRPSLPIALCGALLALASACSSDASSSDAASTAPSATAPSSPSTSPSTSPSSSASAPVEPATPSEGSATPLTGNRIDGKTLSFVLPADYEDQGGPANGLIATRFLVSAQRASIVNVSELSDITTDLTLEGAAALSGHEGMTREADRMVGGKLVYVFTEVDEQGSTKYDIGRVSDDEYVTELTIGFMTPGPDDEALIESVLATVVWKS